MPNYHEYQRVIKFANTSTRACGSKASQSHSAASISKPTASRPRRKITRTKTGCYCCRRRKKKCDERKPVCSGCLRNMLQCVYPEEHQHQHEETARRPRQSANANNSKFTLLLDAAAEAERAGETREASHEDCQTEHDCCHPLETPTPSSPDSVGSPYTPCSPANSGTADYITPVSSPHLKPYVMSSIVGCQFASYVPPKAAKTVISVRSLLN